MSVTRGQETRRGHMRRREWKLIKKGVLGGTYTKCVTSRQKGGHWVREAAGIWGGGSRLEGEKSKQKLRVFVKAMGEIYSLVC